MGEVNKLRLSDAAYKESTTRPNQEKRMNCIRQSVVLLRIIDSAWATRRHVTSFS